MLIRKHEINDIIRVDPDELPWEAKFGFLFYGLSSPRDRDPKLTVLHMK